MKKSNIYLGIIAALGSTLIANSVWAADDDSAKEEKVMVTGSRIKRTDVEGSAPVMTLSRADIEKSGLTSIADVLQQITTGGSALNTKFNSPGNFGNPPSNAGIGAGSAQVDLRNLGSNRVLVLVDGQRWVNESSASGVGGSVDLNTIPMSIVERIEVLEDGASSIYGSDAISGVVNIITRKDFEGMDFSTYAGQYKQGDGKTTKLEFTVGGGSDKFHSVFSASYNKQEQVSAADRSLSRDVVPGHPGIKGSSGTPQGRFIFNDPSCPLVDTDDDGVPDTHSCDLTSTPGTTVESYPEDFHGFGETGNDRFNYAPYNLVVTPNERKGIFESTSYELGDNLTWYTKALYNNRTSSTAAAPEPIFVGSDAGAGPYADSVSIPANQQYNPFHINLCSSVDAFGPDSCEHNFFLATRRPLEGGPRIFKQTVDTFFFGTGLKGSFGQSWDWDVNYGYSTNHAEQQFINSFNTAKIKLALGDPAVCASTPGCVPLNLFGGMGADGKGTITQDMLNWIQMTTKDSSLQGLRYVSANVSGELFQLPAGPFGVAAGVESRNYSGTFTPDAVRINGESNDSIATPISDSYGVREAYTEVNIPVGIGLEFNAAERFSDYDTFGKKSTSKIGFKWKLGSDVLLRGSWSQAFRAPTIGELNGNGQFGASLTDHCNKSYIDALKAKPETSAQGDALTASCAALGIPANYEQNNSQITVLTGGNHDLKPEKSNSVTAGIVYSPSWAKSSGIADSLDFELTHFQYKMTDVILPPDAQTDLLDVCDASGNPNSSACSHITRSSTGQITNFVNRLDNLETLETKGFDFRIDWRMQTRIGKLSAIWQTTRVQTFDAPRTGRDVGIEGNDSGIPQTQSNLVLGWAGQYVSASFTTRYMSELTESCTFGAGFCSNPTAQENKLDATIYNDLQVTWMQPFSTEGLRLTFGINNVFDKDPPTCYSCTLNGYDASTYDVQGSFYYIQLAYRK